MSNNNRCSRFVQQRSSRPIVIHSAQTQRKTIMTMVMCRRRKIVTAALPILCATAMMVPIGSCSAVPADTEKRGVGDDMHRQPRFRGRGLGAGYEREEKEDESGTRGHDFYDLSDFTEDEVRYTTRMQIISWHQKTHDITRHVQTPLKHAHCVTPIQYNM